MVSNVYFADFRARSSKQNKISKIRRLYEKAGFDNFIVDKSFTAIKMHFGERGNDSFINPVYVRQIVDKVKDRGAKPFITDTNTLYSGSRHNSVDHLITAIEHGFDFAVVGAPLIIADGLTSQNYREVDVGLKHFEKVKIASDILAADSMIVLSHFKGHEMAGFGGAIKNLAMGCAPAAGKKDQHSPRPAVGEEQCIGCSKCMEVCPQQAIHQFNHKSHISRDACIGCGECMTVCPAHAIQMDWMSELEVFVERLTEYAYGAVKNKKHKTGYMNFLMNITPDCDCVPWSDAAIVPDIGILASQDPVAIDQASYDLVNQQLGLASSLLKANYDKGEDKFKGIRNHIDGTIQLCYGESTGMGARKYNLIEI